jgi:transcriptional regulator with PAS, ATPase and Fis domain
MQTYEGADDEVCRVVSAEGVVIRQFKNRDAEVLFGDGVRAEFSKKRLEWIVTNNLGKRRSFRDGVEEDMERIPAAVETD